MQACLTMTYQSGCMLNPAQGLAQAIYTLTMANDKIPGQGSYLIKNTWPYCIFPYIGALLAATAFHMHKIMNSEENPSEVQDNRVSNNEDNILANKSASRS